MTHLLFTMGCFTQELITRITAPRYGHIMETALQTGPKFLTNQPVTVFFMGGEATQFLIVFQDYLYAGTVYGQNAPIKKSGQLWRTNNPVNGNSWNKVFDYKDWLKKPAGGDIGDLMSAVVFDGFLYVSARAIEGGKEHPEIFRSADGITWTKVLDNGFNNMTDRFAYPFEVFDGKLYVSVRNDIDGPDYGELLTDKTGSRQTLTEWLLICIRETEI